MSFPAAEQVGAEDTLGELVLSRAALARECVLYGQSVARVADFIKKKFDLGEEVVFLGTFPNDNGSSIVITPYEHFLSKAVEK